MIDIRELYNILQEEGANLPPFDVPQEEFTGNQGYGEMQYPQQNIGYFDNGGSMPVDRFSRLVPEEYIPELGLEEIQPIARNMKGLMGDYAWLENDVDLSYGNTSNVFRNESLVPEQVTPTTRTLQDVYRDAGETIPTASTAPTATTTTTQKVANAVVPGRISAKTSQPVDKQSNNVVSTTPSTQAPVPQAAKATKPVARKVAPGRMVGEHNITTGVTRVNGEEVSIKYLENAVAEINQKVKTNTMGSFTEANELFKLRKMYNEKINSWKEAKDDIKRQELNYDRKSGNVTYNGKRYNITNPNERAKLDAMMGASETPFRTRMKYQAEIFGNNPSPFQQKSSFAGKPKMATGGELIFSNPQLGLTKEQEEEMRRRNNLAQGLPEMAGIPTSSPYTPTVNIDSDINNLSNISYANAYGADGNYGNQKLYSDRQRDDIRTAESNLTRYTTDANGKLKKINIKQGEQYQGVLDDFYNSDEVQKQLIKDTNQLDSFFGILGQEQEYEIGDDLRFIGESMAFDVNDFDYASDGARKVAKGANLAKGIFAGLDAVVGGARDLYSGYATQKRTQQSQLDYQRKQREALEKQKLGFAKGGQVADIYSMFQDEEEQDYRANLPMTQLMTGEFTQQDPSGKEEYNAEVENKEYLQYTDGGVQQVIGRSHTEGGERLNLEEGTTVISDKVQVGKEHAKTIGEQLGIKVNPKDTFAKVVEKYTKHVGLAELNTEQEKYFTMLEKVSNSETSNDITSELNNEFLSKKIHDIELKKEELEILRSAATAMVFDLQEQHKEATGINSPNGEHANGGVVQSFADGGKKTYSFDEYIQKIELGRNNPRYKFRDLTAQGARLKEVAGIYGVSLTDADIATQEQQDEVARLLQNDFRKNNSKVAEHYSANVAPTQLGLQSALDSGLLDKKDLEDLGVKVSNGRVLIGSFGDGSASNRAKLTQVIQQKGKERPTEYQNFVSKNFNDGKWFYRFPEVNTIGFDSEAERDETLKNRGYEVVSENGNDKIYYSNEEGQYFNTTIQGIKEAAQNAASPEPEVKPFSGGQKSPYRAPILPSQRPVAPSAASPVPLYQTRIDRMDPMRLGFDEEVSEVNRQASSVMGSLDGLTDQQRAATLTNMSANTQNVIGDIVGQTAVQNTNNLAAAQQFNIGQSTLEEQARVANAATADAMWGKTEAIMEADKRDYLETLQHNRVSKFNYLTKDRQMHDMVENFRVGRDGGIEFDEASRTEISFNPVTNVMTYKDKNGKIKTEVVKVKTDTAGQKTTEQTTASRERTS